MYFCIVFVWAYFVCVSRICALVLYVRAFLCVCAWLRVVDPSIHGFFVGKGGIGVKEANTELKKKQFYFFAFTARVVFDRPLDRAEELCTLHSLLYVCALYKKSERKREKKSKKGKEREFDFSFIYIGISVRRYIFKYCRAL